MSCPTCSATMEGCGYQIFHCPRCGTLLMRGDVAEKIYVPSLVGRCRGLLSEWSTKFGKGWQDTLQNELHRLGILESIHLPQDRRPQ